jgi:hypothetical protein
MPTANQQVFGRLRYLLPVRFRSMRTANIRLVAVVAV